MKTRTFSLTLLLLLLVGVCNLNAETIKGNGKIVTKEFNVSDFDEITMSVSATVKFTQSDEYSLTVTIDENLLQFVSVKTYGDDLRIRQLPSKDGKPLMSFSFGDKDVNVPQYQFATLEFTKFEITISAPHLEDVKVTGSGTFMLVNAFSDQKLDINVNGSGEFVAKKQVKVNELDVEMAGSGSVAFAQVTAEEAEVTLSGSGNATLNGSFVEMDLKVMGTGNIIANGDVRIAKAKIAGSGDIRIENVLRLLKYDIAGSGNVYYSGDAEIRGFTAGSGTIQRR